MMKYVRLNKHLINIKKIGVKLKCTSCKCT